MRKKCYFWLALNSLVMGCGWSQAQELGFDEALSFADSSKKNQKSNDILALQTGPDGGPSYAGGMVVDKVSESLYLTGTTYGSIKSSGTNSEPLQDSSCFFGVLVLPSLQWKQMERFDDKNMCSTLSTFQENEGAIVVGSTKDTQNEDESAGKETTGFALDLEMINGEFELLGDTTMNASNVQHPVAVATRDNQVWVVSMVSDDTKVTADHVEKVTATGNKFPNFSVKGLETHDARFTVSLERYTRMRSEEAVGESIEKTLTLDWRHNLNEHAVMESFSASGMLLLGDDLVIVGSMRGLSNGDMDGVIIKVTSSDGFLPSVSSAGRSVSVLDSSSSSESGRDDDWILNVCADPEDNGYFYIVGATKGSHDPSVVKDDDDLTVHALFAKIKLETLKAVWTRQYSVKHAPGTAAEEATAAALGCAVIPGEELMYVAGVVDNSATIGYQGGGEEEQLSAGGQDIFVSLVSTDDGTTRWLKQVGSSGDESIARGGGIGVDANKNAVVFGDTNGNLFRNRNTEEQGDKSDLFVMLLNYQDGTHHLPVGEEVSPPVESSVSSQDSSTDSQPPPPSTIKKKKNVTVGDRMIMIPWTFIVSCVVAFLVMLCFGSILVRKLRYKMRRKKLEEQSSEIFMYLKDFDVDDVDLRRSPPGGWHGIYLNKLKYGFNHLEAEDTRRRFSMLAEDRSLSASSVASHSSVVKDFLFMDT